MRNFLSNIQAKLGSVVLLGSTALTTGLASASGGGAVDVSDVVTAIGGAAAPIAAIGGAVLTILVGIKVYKWVRRAM